jgi:ligand-binding sensor domain-containing protein/two-component sensor histidine kinase
MRRIFYLFIIYILFQSNLLAQIPGLTQFTTDNGLPSNTIYDSVQDENGFMWFATDYGISKFDGLSFKNYTVADGLPGNEILYFFKDSINRIWMVAFNGNVGYIQNEIFYNKENIPFLKKLHFEKFVHDIFEDSKGQIWFYQNFSNIKVLKPNLIIENYNINNDTNLKYLSLFVEDNSQQVHLLTYINKKDKAFLISKPISKKSNLIKWEEFIPNQFSNSSIDKINSCLGILLNEKNKTIKKIAKHSIKLRNNFLIRTYKIGDDYWITSLNDGALIFNKSDGFNTPKKVLKKVQTTRAYIDLEKNIWIGSQSNGIFLFPNLHINGMQFEDKSKNDIHTVSLFQNKLVVGNEQSEIILLNSKTLKIVATFKLDKNPKRIRQLNIFDDHLFILGDYNIHRLNSDLKLERIKNMYDSDLKNSNLKNFKDLSISKDYIYIANANGVGKINKATKASHKIWNKRSTAICNDENENSWIGTTTGLYFYSEGVTKKYKLNKQFDNSIIYALENSEKGLLIGSNSYGLGVLKNGKFDVISKKNGLLSNYIKSIFIDKKNNIWLSTNFGLNCIKLNDVNGIYSIKSYTTSDGLYSNDVRASYVNENNVYVATSKGLNIINLSLEKNSITTPKIYLNNILLNNKNIEKKNDQKFIHNLNNVQFNFSGISFKSLGNITFKYRLKGLESDWITTKSNTIRYSSLQPNEYTFEVKAISKNNLESAPLLFSFTIKPPIYKTWWFISISILTILALIAYFFYRRTLKIKHNQKNKEQILNLRFKALNAQMNPHFINNLLVNIHNLANKGAVNEVKESLNQFAELVNLVLSSTKSNLINLSDEIEMAKLYLELQKLRFNKKIEYTINTKLIPIDELDAILVPPMILQPIIENSFKHGFINENKTNKIIVDFKIENNEFLICDISDNGIGIENSESLPKSESSGISFFNINERLRLINDLGNEEKLIFISNITDEFDTLVGLKVTLKIPLISF